MWGRAVLLPSGLGRSGERDSGKIRLSPLAAFVLYLIPGVWVTHTILLAAFEVPLRTIRLTGPRADHGIRPERFHIGISNLDVRHGVLNNIHLQCASQFIGFGCFFKDHKEDYKERNQSSFNCCNYTFEYSPLSLFSRKAGKVIFQVPRIKDGRHMAACLN